MRIECAHSELVKVSDLIPHPNNRNKHSEKQIKALAKIIAKNGQRSPIVVSKLSGYITKGHGRYEAIKLLGWESCAVDFQNYKDELEELNDRIADNEISRYAEFDRVGFLEDIKDLEINIEEIDFEEFGLIDFKFENVEEKTKEDSQSIEDTKEYLIIVSCKDELEQQDLYQEFQTREIKCKLME